MEFSYHKILKINAKAPSPIRRKLYLNVKFATRSLMKAENWEDIFPGLIKVFFEAEDAKIDHIFFKAMRFMRSLKIKKTKIAMPSEKIKRRK